MFPDTARAKGHDYNGKHYDAATNYSDSSVLIYVPKFQTEVSGKINLVFWFHGWGNSIDSAINNINCCSSLMHQEETLFLFFRKDPKMHQTVMAVNWNSQSISTIGKRSGQKII
jgi:hypothetical protein